MRIRHLVLTTLFLMLAAFAFAHHGPKTLTIDAAARKQPPVVFMHEKHAEFAKACDTCHHTQKGLKSDAEKVVKCTTCHLDPKSDKIPSMREMSMTRNPFHGRCVACHKEQKKGPTACNGCHLKK